MSKYPKYLRISHSDKDVSIRVFDSEEDLLLEVAEDHAEGFSSTFRTLADVTERGLVDSNYWAETDVLILKVEDVTIEPVEKVIQWRIV